MNIRIHTHDLVKRYGKRTVVNHASVEVKQGEIVGLLGPNGAGKTTTFYMVVGLIKPDEGAVYLDNDDITKLAMYKRAQLGIGYLPQEASVFRKLSVEDNISAVLEMTKLSRKEQKAKLESLLDEFRLHHVRKSPGDVLSGGERRRTEIARALAVDPKFILLDEPFAGIDPIAVEDIQAIVAKLKYKNIGILITDHNVTETLSICDRAYLLIEGKIFKHGTAEELAEDDEVKRLYLGRNFELKRKDYLLDGWHNPRVLEVDSIIRSLEDLRQQILTKADKEVLSTDALQVDLNDTTILENSWEDIDQTTDDAVSAIRLFLQTGSDNNFKKEVEAVLAADYDRRQKVDALLAAFQKYQLSHAE
ncbi:MAG TPA: LPS export ABC transporter ATP-binding protein [Flavisolibacter sp.]|jgi:lipopolysaccharide export system ATP-binding protein|nr:LPS export ABC transporter ATP-binding protein [Flavisolibacter sp.]